MSAISTTEANTLVKAQVANMLVEPLQAASVILNSGVKIFDSSEPLRIPTITGNTNPQWVGENELIPEADNVEFGEIELMPVERKSIKTITRVSNELIRMATIGVNAVLQDKIVNDVTYKLDTELLTGAGVGGAVTGVMNQKGIENAPFDPADPDTILDALAALAANEVTANRLFLAGADFFTMRKLKDNTGRYLLQPDPTAAASYRLQGVPVTVTNKLPAGKGFIADMASLAVVRDIAPQVTIDPSRYLEYDQQGIHVVTRYDIGVIRPEGVLILESE